MNKKRISFKRISAVTIVFLILATLACSENTESNPNFLIIFTDDQTYRAIGYNNDLVQTPNLDNLAKFGMIFERAYTTTPVCTASRASILTGLYPQTNGTVALDTDSFIENIVEEKKYKTLAHFLNDAGYATYFSGKSHLGDPKDYGFQFGEISPDYNDKKTFRDASAFINDSNLDQRSFLIWLAPRQPHVPLKPDQKWIDLYSEMDIPIEENFLVRPPQKSFYNQGLPGEIFFRDSDYTNNYNNLPAGPPRSPDVIKEFTKAYYATISHLDFQVGNLIEQLKSKGQFENTVVIFLSDNGYFLGNHGLGNKLTMHEESIRIPMFIYWDKLDKKGISSNELVSTVDVLPTIFELAGLNIPNYLQGTSLVPLFSNPSKKIHDYIISESVGVGGNLNTGHRMVRTKDWKYILTGAKDTALYNLKNDLYEQENLIGVKQHQDKLFEMKSYLEKWQYLVKDEHVIPSEVNSK